MTDWSEIEAEAPELTEVVITRVGGPRGQLVIESWHAGAG